MSKRKTDKGENMVVAGLDQDHAAADEAYLRLTPYDRGEIADWLARREGEDLRNAPVWILNQIRFYASIAFLETGLRYGQRRDG